MSDLLVKALREGIEPYTGIPAAEATMDMAADEIERLKAAQANMAAGFEAGLANAKTVIERLRKEKADAFQDLRDIERLRKDDEAKIERLEAALREIASQCHNLPRGATAERIDTIARAALEGKP